MHRIDGQGATPQETFTEGDVQSGTPPTTVTAPWLTSIQEELAAVIEASGIVLDKANNGQLLQALGGGGAGGMKNLLINGEFSLRRRLWTSGTGYAVADALVYTLDRWVAQADGSGGANLVTLDIQARTAANSRIGSALNNDLANALQVLRFNMDGSTTTVEGAILEQRFEGLLETVGEDVTFSIYIEADAGAVGTLEIVQHFGDGGTASPEVLVATDSINPGAETGFRRFHISGTCPVIGGKTIDGTPSLRVRWRSTLGVPVGAHSLWFALAQLERSGSPSGFDHRPAALEQALANRYFERSYPSDVGVGEADFSGIATAICEAGPVAVGLMDRFSVEKRVVPTMVWYAHDGQANRVTWGAILTVTGTSSSLGKGTTGEPIVNPNGPAGVARAHWTADAEI